MPNFPQFTPAGGSAGTQTVGMSNLGNTSGTTGVVSGSRIQFLFAGGNNITLSQSLDAANSSGTISISAANQSVESQSIGMSNLGNTSGTTGIASGGQVRYLLAGGNNVTLSQSLDVGKVSGTITISVPNVGVAEPALRLWQNAPVSAGTTARAFMAGSILIFPLDVGNAIFPGDMTVKTVVLNMFVSSAIGTSSHSYTFNLGFYTISGSSTLALVHSGSTSWGLSGNTSNSISYQGYRWLTIDGTLFSQSTLTLSNALYYGAIFSKSSGANVLSAASFVGFDLLAIAQRSGTFVTGSSTNATRGWQPYSGFYSATTSAFPTSIHISEITRTATGANFFPHMYFNNLLSVW